MKILVIALLVLIVISLGSALFFLYADRMGSRRTAKALTIRVGLSFLLFLVLMLGYYFGVLGNRH